jgi:hypothetical protein
MENVKISKIIMCRTATMHAMVKIQQYTHERSATMLLTDDEMIPAPAVCRVNVMAPQRNMGGLGVSPSIALPYNFNTVLYGHSLGVSHSII